MGKFFSGGFDPRPQDRKMEATYGRRYETQLRKGRERMRKTRRGGKDRVSKEAGRNRGEACSIGSGGIDAPGNGIVKTGIAY